MLQGAPDRRLYRHFAAASPAEAQAQAQNFAYYVSAYGFVPVAQRWDADVGTLAVAYAAVGPASRTAPGPAVGRALVSLLIVVGLAVLVGLGHFRPADRTSASAPPSASPGRAAAAPSSTPHAGRLPHFEPAECRSDMEYGRQTDCGELTVLEDRSKPDGRRITLHVAIHRPYTRQVKPDPIVYLEGGPGGAPLVDGYWPYPFLDEREVIVFDQRGTGLAQPSLSCDELNNPFLSDQFEAMRRCHDRLAAQGIELAAYNSAQSAADLADLRIALGYDEWNLYGVSYGTRLALTTLRDHAPGLRSLILDSVYPPHVDIYGEMPLNAQRAFNALFEACRADAQCADAYPWLEDRFYELVERLDRHPIEVGGGLMGIGATAVDGRLLLDYFFSSMYVTDFLADLPAELDGFTEGDWSLLDWYWASYSPEISLNGAGFYYTVQCAEELPFAERAQAGQQQSGVRAVVSRAFDWREMYQVCAVWDVPAAEPLENLPVVSGVPVLLLAGDFDPITPPRWAEAAAEHLSAAQLILVPGVGHGVVGSSYCVDDIVSQFLEDPLRPVDAGCLDRLRQPEFRLPE